MKFRWKAKVYYRVNAGILLVDHEFEELSELHNLIERGPHWDTINKIEITLLRPAEDSNLTVEAAEKK